MSTAINLLNIIRISGSTSYLSSRHNDSVGEFSFYCACPKIHGNVWIIVAFFARASLVKV